MTDLDQTDQRIIALLSTDARMPVARLAQKLGLARTTAQARLERLERAGVIAGYTLRLSDMAVAGQIRATVLLQIRPQVQNTIVMQLRRIPEVELAHTTSGRFDMALQIRAGSTGELDATLDRIGAIEGVSAMESLIHLTTRIDRALSGGASPRA
ncbi:MAG: Lrp/AsnC family transcriptional regulator [Rubellimicrobium sp.]|nr:Lrp/AsnC family transcriptional regulator [Rubellimicrobium sp.]